MRVEVEEVWGEERERERKRPQTKVHRVQKKLPLNFQWIAPWISRRAEDETMGTVLEIGVIAMTAPTLYDVWGQKKKKGSEERSEGDGSFWFRGRLETIDSKVHPATKVKRECIL